MPNRSLTLGLMSGTSMDGVDYALCATAAHRIRLIRHWQVPFPPALRRRIRAAADGAATTHELAQLHHDLGRFYAAHARGPAGTPPAALVGLHGQTVFHHPDRRSPATLQIGEPAYLAESLGVPVVANFRAADLAAGGEGAPLATLFHRVVFGQPGLHVCVQNLGGIANVTSLDAARTARPRVLAFDTGPANVLIDLAAGQLSHGRVAIDRGGRWAARGSVQAARVHAWLRHPYFHRRPPKSTGRELFGPTFLDRVLGQMADAPPEDVLATLTEFTARSIADAYVRHLPRLPDRVVLCGGGAANPHLVARITAALCALNPALQICDTRAYGWPREAVEAGAFALLASYRLRRRPGNLPETTGARRSVVLGQVADAPPRRRALRRQGSGSSSSSPVHFG